MTLRLRTMPILRCRLHAENLKVFIGPTEIANIGATLAGSLRDRGIEVTVVTHRTGPFQAGMRYDHVLDFKGLNKLQRILRYLYCFLKFFPRHNVFIFLFGETLLPRNLDLPILKLFRKRTVMWFVGSDIRHYEFVAAAARKAGIQHYLSEERVRQQREAGPRALERKLRMIHKVEKYVSHINSGPTYSQLLTRRCIRISVPLDICNIRYDNTPNSRPVVVHAPSRPGTKGTAYVVAAVERLKQEGCDFDFRLFTQASNIEVREALSEADISVDQLFGLAPGVFALESMAAGCAVLGSSYPEFAGFPPELPVVHTDPDNIYQNLKMLLENPELRRELGERGRKYVEKYHDHRKIADDFIRLLITGEADITYDPCQNRTPQ